MTNLQEHWNKAYGDRETKELGWYENISSPSLELISNCNLSKSARIINIGAGTSTLTDSLLEEGYINLVVTDISDAALDQLKARISDFDIQPIFIQEDLTQPERLSKLEPMDLWHDRAVLHFLTLEKDRQTYFELLRNITKKGSFVILAEFELEEGAEKCCNLDVFRYNTKMLSDYLGSDFRLVIEFPYTFLNPRKDERAYIYTLFERTI